MMMAFAAITSCAPKGEKAPALDLSDLDTTVSPKVDFYKYATGGWQAKNPLRPEFSRFGSFDVIAETNQKQLNELFESMASMKAEKGTVDQKISDLYKMALDSTTRNELGAKPILADIARVQAVSSKDELWRLLAQMELEGTGAGFYGSGVDADLANSDMQVLYLGQGGLGMGDRDYYLKEENAALKEGYRNFLVKILNLCSVENAEQIADKTLEVENHIAEYSWTREQNRDMTAIYNPMSSEQIFAAYPSIGFAAECEVLGIPAQ